MAAIIVTAALALASDQQIRRGGSYWAEVSDSGTIRINGSSVGSFENGTVRKNGSVIGEVSSSGTIRHNGSVVGEVSSSGTLRRNGSVIGEISSSGTIRKGGSIWGEASGCGSDLGRQRVAAVLYFFSDDF